MKKASKILTLILIVVFVLSVFAGCDLVGRNVAKYRSTTAMTVGEQEITIGKLLDTFNSYYNSYYYYISAGYLTADSLLEMVMNSLTQQYMQIDDYVTRHKHDLNLTTALKGVVKNAEYLSEEQFAYCIKYVKYTSFTTFDTTVLTTLSVKHDIGDAKEEDTSRDFTEYEEIEESTYAAYLLNQSFVDEDADEYFEKYYSNIKFTSIEGLIDGYVYSTEAEAKAILDELNDRLEDESDEITFDEYQNAQQKAIDQYSDGIKNSYGITLQEFMEGQVADMVSSSILALWKDEKHSGIHARVIEEVKKTDETYAKDQEGKFALNDDFDSFITGLSDSSFIYEVPETMREKYVFVKNILIPFSAEQTALLNAHSDASYGGTDTDAYIKLRNLLATEIVAEYFDSEKYDETIESHYFSDEKWFKDNTDEDSKRKYEKIGGLFTLDGDSIAIDPASVLGQFFLANGEVAAMTEKGDNAKSETIIELMKRFNTDVGQHSNRYDYVVYVGQDWEDYSHSWVKEFYTAVNELMHDSEGNLLKDNTGKYAMCISTYGVHIIYVEGFVEEQIYDYKAIDWTKLKSWNDTSKLSYTRYKEEFDSQSSDLIKEELEKLQAKYFTEDKITVNGQFQRFLKDNGFTFDFGKFKEEILDELDIDD